MMKNYKIHYFYEGDGSVIIKAKSKRDAEDDFFKGEFCDEKEIQTQVSFDYTEELKN